MNDVSTTRHAERGYRALTIIAQDPSVKGSDGKILRAAVRVPAEELLPGPRGYRVVVIDYDATTNTLFQPLDLAPAEPGKPDLDDYARKGIPDATLLSDPRFHAQNVYAIVMRILSRFELALGRRVGWGSNGHQLHIMPHAFAEPNAFYSREDRALLFGYFASDAGEDNGTVLTCLSHDVVAHETTHALLDGLRRGFLEPSSADPAAFHEGFADVVALLSVFALPEVVGAILDGNPDDPFIDERLLEEESLRGSSLFKLAEEMGQSLSQVRGQALRHSIELEPGEDLLTRPEYQEEHTRGELLVAAMLHAFLDIWIKRLRKIGPIAPRKKDRSIVVEEGSRAADHLLTIAIRAIDYCPPVDISFGDYLTALLTIDGEVVPDDRYGYRASLLENFKRYGIKPTSPAPDGAWLRWNTPLTYSRTHFDSMLRDDEEMFRFIWENRRALDLDEDGYVEVKSVRPSTRIAPDGFVLRETVAEYVQILNLTAGELRDEFGVKLPRGMPSWREVTLFGGATLIFDEYGQLKYRIGHHLPQRLDRPNTRGAAANRKRHAERLQHLWDTGFYEQREAPAARLAGLHFARAGIRRPIDEA